MVPHEAKNLEKERGVDDRLRPRSSTIVHDHRKLSTIVEDVENRQRSSATVDGRRRSSTTDGDR